MAYCTLWVHWLKQANCCYKIAANQSATYFTVWTQPDEQF